MSEENVAIVRAVYEHWARGDFPASFFDPDVEHSRIGADTPDMEGEWIGERMFISKETVKTHLSHIFRRFEVHSRAQLTARAVERERAGTELASAPNHPGVDAK